MAVRGAAGPGRGGRRHLGGGLRADRGSVRSRRARPRQRHRDVGHQRRGDGRADDRRLAVRERRDPRAVPDRGGVGGGQRRGVPLARYSRRAFRHRAGVDSCGAAIARGRDLRDRGRRDLGDDLDVRAGAAAVSDREAGARPGPDRPDLRQQRGRVLDPAPDLRAARRSLGRAADDAHRPAAGGVPDAADQPRVGLSVDDRLLRAHHDRGRARDHAVAHLHGGGGV